MSDVDRAGLTTAQVVCMARGLYWLANLDGVKNSEVSVIEEFLRETGSPLTVAALQAAEFDPRDLPFHLETSHQRLLFLKAAVALVASDGELSARERVGVRRCARLLGYSEIAFEEFWEEARHLSLDTASVTP